MSSSHFQPSHKAIKVVLLGDCETGKTRAVNRFVTELEFENAYSPTMGMNVFNKTIDISEKQMSLQIWDTSGSNLYYSLSTIYYRNADIFMLFVNLNDRNSFKNLPDHLLKIKDQTNSVALVVANKSDEIKEEVSKDEFENFCKEEKLPFIHVDVKKNDKVKEAFLKSVELYTFSEKNTQNSIAMNKAASITAEAFSSYRAFYKFTIFGYHHFKRADVIKEVLEKTPDIKTKLEIIESQIALFTGKAPDPSSLQHLGIENRWLTELDLINKPNDRSKPSGGYFKELCRLKDEYTKIDSQNLRKAI